MTNKKNYFTIVSINSNKKVKNSLMKEISALIHSLNNEKEIEKFLYEILTETEISTLSKRWRILKLLAQETTQREIANKLNVSLCKVTRGSKILKNKNAITTKFLNKGEKNGNLE